MTDFNPSEENIPRQRAALMGLITAIMKDENETPLVEIKRRCANAFAYMIDQDAMVGDIVDILTAEVMQEFCLQEKALEDARNLLGED